MGDEISAEEIEPAMLFRINRMLDEEMDEMVRFVRDADNI